MDKKELEDFKYFKIQYVKIQELKICENLPVTRREKIFAAICGLLERGR